MANKHCEEGYIISQHSQVSLLPKRTRCANNTQMSLNSAAIIISLLSYKIHASRLAIRTSAIYHKPEQRQSVYRAVTIHQHAELRVSQLLINQNSSLQIIQQSELFPSDISAIRPVHSRHSSNQNWSLQTFQQSELFTSDNPAIRTVPVRQSGNQNCSLQTIQHSELVSPEIPAIRTVHSRHSNNQNCLLQTFQRSEQFTLDNPVLRTVHSRRSSNQNYSIQTSSNQNCSLQTFQSEGHQQSEPHRLLY